MEQAASGPFRVAFVSGVTPDKWARTWRDRSRRPLRLELVDQDRQERVLRDREADMAFVRLPIDREGVHCIPLYDEVPVVVVPLDHPVTAYDEIALDDLGEEQVVLGEVEGWVPSAPQLDWPPMSAKDAIEVVASGSGVALVPLSVARLHHRRDVAHRPVTGMPGTTIGLAWLASHDDEDVQAFIGVVRGRTANSSR